MLIFKYLLNVPKLTFSLLLLTSMLRTSLSADLLANTNQITVEYDEINDDDNKLVKKTLKS